MHPTLKCLEAELTGSLTGLSLAELGAVDQAEPGKWSIHQIVCHLLLSYQTTIDVFEARIAKGTPTRTKPTLWQRLGQIYIVNLGRFPRGRMAPAAVDPSRPFQLCSVEDLIDRIQVELTRFDAVADRAAELFGNLPAITHIVLGPMPVDSWRTFHLIHGRHHIDQILALRKPKRVRNGVVSDGIFAIGRSKASNSL
jgi:hypothetical protein